MYAGTVATMYEEGTPVRSASASGGPAAGGNLSFPATLWKDYTLITDHYATAYILNGGFYYNPYYFQSGSCDDYNTDCTFVPGGGYLYVSTALIYLGSTATEHTNVAIDGSDVPLSDNDAYTGFMDKVPPPTKDQLNDFKFSVTKLLKDYRIAALVAASAYQHSQDEQVRSYQIPIRDDISEPAPPITRTRRYKALDIYGNSWRAVNPLRIDEYLTYVAGDLPLGTPNSVGWEIDSTHGDYNRLNYGSGAALEDDYSVGNPFVSDTSEIDFWQMYSASNFRAAGTTFPKLDDKATFFL